MNTAVADRELFPAARHEVPGPPGPPLLGWRANLIPALRDPAVFLRRLHDTYGDVVSLARGTSQYIMFFSPEYNRQVLSDQHTFYSLNTQDDFSPVRMPDNSAAARLLSGVAGMNGERHIQHRRMMMPAFHKKRVEGMRDLLVSTIDNAIGRWQVGQTIDVKHEMVSLTLAVAVGGLLGLDPDEEGSHVRRTLEQWSVAALAMMVHLVPFDIPGLPRHRFLVLSQQLEAEFMEVIRRKRSSGIDGGDALSMLLQAHDEDGTRLTDTELLGHLTTLFTAGHETTASALTWILFLLSQHPQVTSNLFDELDGVLHGDAPTVEQLRELPMLEWVINEGLRVFPPAIWFMRNSTAPFSLGPYSFDKGTHLVASPAVVHRRPDVYSQPDRFMPERWQTLDPSPYEYMPFGAGPRRCLGATFATLEMKLAIAMIVQRFRLSPPPGTRVDRGGTILSLPAGSLPLRVHAQDRLFSKEPVTGNVHQWVALD